jgi:predicted RNA polymerase sigma factor
VLQAAIAACHARARRAEDTDWVTIAALYGSLHRLTPTPVVELNRAVAVAMAFGPERGLEILDAISTDPWPGLRNYHPLPTVRGDLLARLGRTEEARVEFARAAELTRNERERAVLRERATTG